MQHSGMAGPEGHGLVVREKLSSRSSTGCLGRRYPPERVARMVAGRVVRPGLVWCNDEFLLDAERGQQTSPARLSEIFVAGVVESVAAQ